MRAARRATEDAAVTRDVLACRSEVLAMSDALQPLARAAIAPPHARRAPWFLLVVFVALACCSVGAMATQDPNRTLTVYVHGFDGDGADRHGVYGADTHEALEDSIAAMAGLPVAEIS